ncbi:hypothetical protein CSUI_007397 [Cystoisospora suis]|uniref:Uncharacterized protein n=1 Tax=Cystoisospora suis TaxID=483139 RepID=A0A2C6KMM2_9APIC|nr:hypothetical protein CSUI_007397 [Cystoisospora suis]
MTGEGMNHGVIVSPHIDYLISCSVYHTNRIDDDI